MRSDDIELRHDYGRPVIDIFNMNGNKVRALLDTGAVVPVWVGTLNNFIAFGGDTSTPRAHVLNGFGGPGQLCPVYHLSFKIDKWFFLNIPFVMCFMNENFSAIITSTLLMSFNYGLINVAKDDEKRMYMSRPGNKLLVHFPKNSEISRLSNGKSCIVSGNYYQKYIMRKRK